ncbi:hypothetical protein GKZ90_0023000 [Flavobacterium sp. MC2016-06]|uniref:hypothetical protein n=1 Tax=Flavobacterium sp. MC2016-06 TaxID=2676308 RepID=UPI0012BADA50|nr:hypothetical protein [Flavobacterium sp. MC2016-06]MBU3861602.1 hypothetical protein [Flavobacterium sp. MC2016-06]
MKKQNIEDIFSSMEDFSSIPPPELWGQIEEKLNKPKKKKRAILWWSTAACLTLGLGLFSVLHFNSNSGIKNINNGSLENNNVVLDQNKNDLEKNNTISTEGNTTLEKSNTSKGASGNKDLNGSKKENTKEIQTAATNTKNNTRNTTLESKQNVQRENTNQAVAEETFVSAEENASNTSSKNHNLNGKKRNTNQAVAEQSFVPANENSFNTETKNQNLNSKKRNTNQAVTEQTYVPSNENAFNTASKNQILNNKKRNTNQALAEQKIVFGKQNKFNSVSKKQLSNSIFDDKLISKNSTNVVYNSLNPTLSESKNIINESKTRQQNQTIATEKGIASTPKENSKFNDVVLSKQDSVQLAELQNLEKGIVTPETKEEKETKALAKKEKWALAVFAGVANSENYRNEKTLGNVNDSKQSSTYGVKTKYKISNKWAVGTGVKINELGQSVANISYVSAKNNAFFAPGDYYQAGNAAAPQISSNSNYILVTSSTKEALQSDNIKSGNLDQSLRYIEMPLEVSYSIFNKNKASINLNTGGFVGKLISNNVALDGNSIGQNINANDYVYGSTLSSTLQYRVYKKTNVFVEPAMNYYINPLNSQSFNQFQWGLNFGLNVSF